MKRDWYKISLTKNSGFESLEDIIYSVDDARYEIMREYYRKGRKKGTMMSWSVIPFARVKKIWEDYSKYGVVRDEAGLNAITDQMLKNLARLQAATELGGHEQMDPDELVKEMGFKPIGDKNDDFYWNFLETQYGTPISDYGLPQLWNLANKLMSTSTSEEKLQILDQMLNVIHQRGDLAALFIEGGRSSLSQLAGSPEEKLQEPQEETMAFNLKRYVEAGLKEYKEKRDFGVTPEPSDSKSEGIKPIFVVQEHKAKKAGLHYDVRLEEGGILKSWAVRKGMPNKGEKHLAIQTEDHPYAYKDFEGTIPEGYGAGIVAIDSQSEYKTIEKDSKKWKFEVLDGKYKGKWTLVNTDGKKWLLMQSKKE